MRMPLSVSKPTEGPWPVWPSRPSRSNMGIHGQKSSDMWCSSSSLFLRAIMGISCRWLYSMGTFNRSQRVMMLLVAQLCCHLLQHVERQLLLNSFQEQKRYLCRQLPSIGGLAGGPGEGVSRTTGHPVDFLALQCSYQPWPLDGIRGSISKLALIIVTPCVHFSWAKDNSKAYCEAAMKLNLATGT